MSRISWATVSLELQHAVFRRRDGGQLILEFPCGVDVGRVVATPDNCQLTVPLQARPFTTWPHWMPVCRRAWCLQNYEAFLESSPSLRSSPKVREELAVVRADLQVARFDPSLPGKILASRRGLLALERSLTEDPDLNASSDSAPGVDR